MIFAHEQKNAVDPDPNYGRPLLYGVRRQKMTKNVGKSQNQLTGSKQNVIQQ